MAVVLSGMGTDGTRGIVAIKEAGGLTFAESRDSARFFSMPQSAIASGWVDEVVSPAALARKLQRIARNPLLLREHQQEQARNKDRIGTALEQIFRVLKGATGVNFAQYKENTLRRRISRLLLLKRVDLLESHSELLRSDAGETEALFNDLLISVTGFFRDKAVFQSLKKDILSRLIGGKERGSELRVWVPGCATGEEVYSLAICIDEVINKLKDRVESADLRHGSE